MPIEIVGRDEEIASVRAFVEGAAERPAALVLEGEPGVGKSTLWLAGVEHARAEGVVVLVARPAEAERGLAHAALGEGERDLRRSASRPGGARRPGERRPWVWHYAAGSRHAGAAAGRVAAERHGTSAGSLPAGHA